MPLLGFNQYVPEGALALRVLMSQHDTATEQVLEEVKKYPLLHVKQEPLELLEEQALQLESIPVEGRVCYQQH